MINLDVEHWDSSRSISFEKPVIPYNDSYLYPYAHEQTEPDYYCMEDGDDDLTTQLMLGIYYD